MKVHRQNDLVTFRRYCGEYSSAYFEKTNLGQIQANLKTTSRDFGDRAATDIKNNRFAETRLKFHVKFTTE